MVKKYQEIKQKQFITELMADAVVQGFVSMKEPFNNPYAEQLADLSLALFLQQRIDRINEEHYLTDEQFFEKCAKALYKPIAKSKTQRGQK